MIVRSSTGKVLEQELGLRGDGLRDCSETACDDAGIRKSITPKISSTRRLAAGLGASSTLKNSSLRRSAETGEAGESPPKRRKLKRSQTDNGQLSLEFN